MYDNVTPLGWHVRDWCKQVGICPATYYNLDSSLKPRSVKVRERRLVIEHPREYLDRVAEQQEPRAA